jgi:hypothetical protein
MTVNSEGGPVGRPTEITDSEVNEALEDEKLDESDLRGRSIRHRDEEDSPGTEPPD